MLRGIGLMFNVQGRGLGARYFKNKTGARKLPLGVEKTGPVPAVVRAEDCCKVMRKIVSLRHLCDEGAKFADMVEGYKGTWY